MMFKLILAVILHFFVICHAGTVLEKLAIMNGTVATEGQFPYQVGIQWTYGGSHFCGGSIINKRYILTAAHCIYNDPFENSKTSTSDNENFYYDNFSSKALNYESSDSTLANSNYENSDLESSTSEGSGESNYEGKNEDDGILDPKSIRIFVGANKLNDKNGIIYKVEKIIKHKHFANHKFKSELADIALIRVTEDIVFNDKVQPVKLASSENKEDVLPVGASVFIAGWGYTRKCLDFHEEYVNDLRMAKRTIYDFDKCQSEYLQDSLKKFEEPEIPPGIHQEVICSVGFQYSCMGDSGSPVVDERGFQVGIVSFSEDLLPDVHTSVKFYSQWIAGNSIITEK
ncbi:chymotrypsin-2-like [Trichogramma pretiosum]|uniref:chymotrypsin-2-like n=1 Tax=Trichogramma pretiosum TaxID=7493 RepID=UPI000C71B633|nr:chymotrypsin-2-like [Trichogramma pretiosum]